MKNQSRKKSLLYALGPLLLFLLAQVGCLNAQNDPGLFYDAGCGQEGQPPCDFHCKCSGDVEATGELICQYGTDKKVLCDDCYCQGGLAVCYGLLIENAGCEDIDLVSGEIMGQP